MYGGTARKLKVAILSSNSLVGEEIESILDERGVLVDEVSQFSDTSEAENPQESAVEVDIEALQVSAEQMKRFDLVFLCTSGDLSRKAAEIASTRPSIVIDTSGHFADSDSIVSVVPEVNGERFREILQNQPRNVGLIVASPDPQTIQLCVALKPLDETFRLKRVNVTALVPVAPAGRRAMDELWNQTLAIFNQGEIVASEFPYQIAFNCIPQVGALLENGYSSGEERIAGQTRRLLGNPKLAVSVSAIRVPVFAGSAQSVTVETQNRVSAEAVRELLNGSPGIMVMDSPKEEIYPVGTEVGGSDATYVGRIREDRTQENTIHFWTATDSLRKGTALNAVHIAEMVINAGYFSPLS